MFPKQFLLAIFFFATTSLFAQYELPAVKYDREEKAFNQQGDLIRKDRYKKDRLILTIHYPNDGAIQGMCERTNLVYDSVYAYLGDQIRRVNFQRGSNKSVYESTWIPEEATVMTKSYLRKTGELRTQKSVRVPFDFTHEIPLCNLPGYNIGNGVGEMIYKNDEGKEIEYKDYSTGVSRKNGQPFTGPGAEMFRKYRSVADALVQKSFGKKFFDEFFTLSYAGSSIYTNRDVKRLQPGKQPRIKGEGNYFYALDKKARYIDYAYLFTLPGYGAKTLTTIRVDSLGQVMYTDPKDWSFRKNVTRGLLEPVDSPGDYLSVDQALKALKKANPKVNLDDVKVGINYDETSKKSPTGQLAYQFLIDPYDLPSLSCNLTLYDIWSVDVWTGEITGPKEKSFGTCMDISFRIDEASGKKGFRSEYDSEPRIPYVYDELSRPKNSVVLIAKQAGKYGLISSRNEVILPLEYDAVSVVAAKQKRFAGQYFSVKKGTAVGLVDYRGKVLLEPVYTSIKLRDKEDIIATDAKEKEIVFKLRSAQ